MNNVERLRLAAAIGHTVPGAELAITTHDDERVLVGRHPAADLDPCAFRRVVVASGTQPGICMTEGDLASRIDSISIGGAIDDLGGGVFSSRIDRREQRWVATTVAPHRVAQLLDGVGIGDVAADAMHACLRPDSDLAITLLAITAHESRYMPRLDEIASSVAATCFVEEVRAELEGDHAHAFSDERKGATS